MVVKKTTTTKKPAVVARAKKAEKLAKEPVVKPAVKTRAKKVEAVKPAPARTKKILTPKEEATKKKQPWVAVLDTHVNPENPSNGFFELDWNEYFVLQLTDAGYSGDNEEEIVDQWFKNLCRNIGGEAGMDMDRRASGFINVQQIAGGKAEIS